MLIEEAICRGRAQAGLGPRYMCHAIGSRCQASPSSLSLSMLDAYSDTCIRLDCRKAFDVERTSETLTLLFWDAVCPRSSFKKILDSVPIAQQNSTA